MSLGSSYGERAVQRGRRFLRRGSTRLIPWFLGLALLLLLATVGPHRPIASASTSRPGFAGQTISLASAEERALEANSITASAGRASTRFQHRKPVTVQDPSRTIEVGLHVENVHQLSLKDKNYWVEGWYWLRWPQAIQTVLEAEKISTDRMVEFTNQIEDNSMSIAIEEPEVLALPGNTFYQSFRFSGKFYVNDLDLSSFPFHEISLPVVIETRHTQLSCITGSCIGLRPDPVNIRSLIGQFAAINGYDIKSATITPFIHQYKSNFGVGAPSAFAAVDFSIRYKTNPLAAFFQSILPLLVIIGIVIASPSLPGSMGDVRLAIPTTALLTMIFLQQSYRSEIPPLSYLCFIDCLYLYAYILSVVIFLLFCWGTYIYTAAPEGATSHAVQRIDRVDSFIQIGAILALVLLVPLAWFLT
jgi:hypothetical protein